jgi:hypothetical protein
MKSFGFLLEKSILNLPWVIYTKVGQFIIFLVIYIKSDYSFILGILSVFILFHDVPSFIILYKRYSLMNGRESFVLYDNKLVRHKRISFNTEEIKDIFHKEDIFEIIVWMTKSHPTRFIGTSIVGYLSYAEIVMTDGRYILISSLYAEDLEQTFSIMKGVHIRSEALYGFEFMKLPSEATLAGKF